MTDISKPVNKFSHMRRLEEVEVVAHGAASEAKRAHARLDAQPPRGETGATGPKGDAGPAGGDSTVPGPQGVKGDSIVGPVGPVGPKGDTVVGPDSAAVLAETRAELATLRALVGSMRAEFDLLSRAFTSSSQKSLDYLDFLRAKTEAATAARRK